MKVSDLRKAHELLIERDKIQRAWNITRSSYSEAKALVTRTSSNETVDLGELIDVKRVLTTAIREPEHRSLEQARRARCDP